MSRGLRLYLLERKMRSLNLNWTFPVYSAYDDSAYSEHMTMLDEIRIKVFEKVFNLNICFTMTSYRKAMFTPVGNSVSPKVAFLKAMIWSMQSMDYGN